ncbi:hypothetical protein [Streptomyces sp. NPDC012746]
MDRDGDGGEGPSAEFGAPNHVRISYKDRPERIQAALDRFTAQLR